MSIKLFRANFMLALVLFLASCSPSESPQKSRNDQIANQPVFHFFHIGDLTGIPLNTPEIFNRMALRQLKIRNICFYTIDSQNSGDTLEKINFSYSPDWQTMHFSISNAGDELVPGTDGKITLDDSLHGSSEFNSYYGIVKKSVTRFFTLGGNYLTVKEKFNGKNDTTIFYGSYGNPRAVVKKIGRKIVSVDLFVEAGSSSKTVKREFSGLGLRLEDLTFAQCSVTFMQNNRPVESYLLNENFAQVNLLRSWKYDAAGRLTEYNEWTGTSLVKNVAIHYTKGEIPTGFSINSKAYFVKYN